MVQNIFILFPQRESSVTVLEGVDVTQTNMSFFRQQLQHIATHILRCTGKCHEFPSQEYYWEVKCQL